MDLSPYFIGAVIGAFLAGMVVYLLFKSTSVARKEFDALNAKHNDVASNLKLADERLKVQQELATSLQQKHDSKQTELTTLLSKIASLEASLKSNTDRLNEHTDTILKERETNRNQQNELNLHQRQVAQLSAQNVSLQEKLDAQKNEIVEMQRTAHLQFEKIAQQIFEEKSGKFTETNKSNIESILKPLSENIENFKKKVEETYDKESKQRFSLEEKVKDLIENTNKISQEANNLATALKGQVKKQGDWGETILESILEKSGLVRDREYFVQANLKDEDGFNLRPDIIVKLPDARHIIVDSKVSLNAYTRFTEAETKELQELYLREHLAALYHHIDQLSQKKYHEYAHSLDFVILFVAIEPAYMMAIQADQDLWSHAYSKRILLISPTNLIAVLKIIADLWNREQRNKNAMEIAKQGTRLYEKFVVFANKLEVVGKHITKSQDSFNDAMGQLKTGKGNLITRVENLKKLGIKSSKNLPAAMQSFEEDDHDDDLLSLDEGQQAESED